MNAIRKSAVPIESLDKSANAEVLSKLPATSVEKLTSELTEAKHITQEEQVEATETFVNNDPPNRSEAAEGE